MSSFTYQKSFVVIVTSNSPLTDLTEKWIADSIDISGSDITFTFGESKSDNPWSKLNTDPFTGGFGTFAK